MEKVCYIGIIKEDKKLKLLNDFAYENENDKKVLIAAIKKDLEDEEIKKEFPNTQWGFIKVKIKEKDIQWIGEIN